MALEALLSLVAAAAPELSGPAAAGRGTGLRGGPGPPGGWRDRTKRQRGRSSSPAPVPLRKDPAREGIPAVLAAGLG